MRYKETIKVRVTPKQKEYLETKPCMSRYIRALITRELRKERQRLQASANSTSQARDTVSN